MDDASRAGVAFTCRTGQELEQVDVLRQQRVCRRHVVWLPVTGLPLPARSRSKPTSALRRSDEPPDKLVVRHIRNVPPALPGHLTQEPDWPRGRVHQRAPRLAASHAHQSRPSPCQTLRRRCDTSFTRDAVLAPRRRMLRRIPHVIALLRHTHETYVAADRRYSSWFYRSPVTATPGEPALTGPPAAYCSRRTGRGRKRGW